MELISREAVLLEIHEAFGDSEENGLTYVIKNLPTIESRPKGKWIVNKRKGGYLQDMICSNCGKTLACDDDLTREYKFCMHCGAEMRQE